MARGAMGRRLRGSGLASVLALAAAAGGCGSSYHCDADCLSRRRAEKACQAGDVDRCEALGNYDQACKLGSGYGCYAAAQKVDPRETIIDEDAAAALVLYQRGCEAGYPRACQLGGSLAWTVPGASLGTGRELLGRGCQQASAAPAGGERPPKLTEGDPTVQVVPRAPGDSGHRKAALESCRDLALALADGIDGAADDGRALELMTRACDGDVDQACTYVGYFHYAGIGAEPNREAALEHFDQACKSEDGDGCSAARVLRDPPPAGKRRILVRLVDDERHEFSYRAAVVEPPGLPPVQVPVQALSFISMSGTVSIGGGWMTAVKGRLVEATPTRIHLAEQRVQNILRVGYSQGDVMLLEWAAPIAGLVDEDCAGTEDCRERGMCGARAATACRRRQAVAGRPAAGLEAPAPSPRETAPWAATRTAGRAKAVATGAAAATATAGASASAGVARPHRRRAAPVGAHHVRCGSLPS